MSFEKLSRVLCFITHSPDIFICKQVVRHNSVQIMAQTMERNKNKSSMIASTMYDYKS